MVFGGITSLLLPSADKTLCEPNDAFGVAADNKFSFITRGFNMSVRELRFDNVRCPKCAEPIPVSETLSQQIAAKLREEMESEVRAKEQALNDKEVALKQREARIEEAVELRLAAAKVVIEKQAAQKVRADQMVELEDLKRQAQEAQDKLDQAQRIELELRTKQREFEERDRLRELEVARKLDAERAKIQEAAATATEEKHRFREAEIQKQLQDALRVNDELKRKLEQGSQQTQGEVLELDLEEALRAAFPLDNVTPVPKGFSGGDILQHVVSSTGNHCGAIIWEAKRTKSFSEAWIPKLKEDQRRAKADIAVLVSEVLPKDCINFQEMKGVWVSNPQCGEPGRCAQIGHDASCSR
jgi:hypothetical protein